MNCHRCGSSMIFKKLCDYGGYSFGWKCILCGEIIDEIPKNHHQRREDGTITKTSGFIIRRHGG